MVESLKTYTLQDNFTRYSPINRKTKFTSKSTNIYKLNDEGAVEDQSLWIVKENINSWIIREFIASGIYQHFLGDLASSSMLIKDDEFSNKVMLAVKYKSNFHMFNGVGDGLSAKLDENDIPFDCVVGRCEIDNGKLKHTNTETSLYNGKPIIGFELATVVSMFTEDQDTYRGMNYAIIADNDSLKVTRFDYDDSFTFMLPAKVVSDHHLLPLNVQFALTGSEYAYYNPAKPGYIKRMFEKEFIKNINSKNLLKALEEVSSVPIEKIREIVHERIETVSTYFSNEELKEIFNFDKLKKFVPDAKTITKSLEDFIVKVLNQRLSELKSTKNCFEIELAAMENNQTKLEELNDFIKENKNHCISMYKNSDYITPNELINLYKSVDYNDEL